MTERKYKSYTLWLKWANLGWMPRVTCLNLPWPAANPRDVLEHHMTMTKYQYSHWKRGKDWMILPEDRKPK